MPSAPSSPLLRASDLQLDRPGQSGLYRPALSFSLEPGLCLVLGGEQRGKTSLLQLMAGSLAPSAGTLQRAPGLTLYFEQPTEAALDDTVAADWLAALRSRHPRWHAATEAALTEAFRLAEHLPKPFYMFSAGSRRKVGLLAAAACGADLTLLDTPYAALDAASCRVLTGLLQDAAEGADGRAWVVADYAAPAGLLAHATIDLGD